MRRPDPLAGVNLLELAPVRVAPWREVGERVALERPKPHGRGLGRIGAWLAHFLGPRRLRLDRVGSFAWKQLDGSTTVGEVARRLRREFGDEVEPAEKRLGLLVRTLHREGLVAYPGAEELPPRSG